MKNNNTDIGILVASCDKYSDLWSPFFAFWTKYWNDCPYPIYLMANKKEYKGINQLFASANNWSDEFMMILEKFPHKYLLYMQDDYFLSHKVDNKRIQFLTDIIISEEPAYLRVYPHPGKRNGILYSESESIQILTKGSPFITSLQASFWNVEDLKRLLVSGESIWDFEINSPERTNIIKNSFMSVARQDDRERSERNYPINYFCTALRKGKWRKDAISFCKEENIPLEISRPIENWWDEYKKSIYDKFPQKYQKTVMRILW